MQRRKSTLLIVLTLLLVIGANTFVITHPSQPNAGHTGAPGENTCATAGCHSGTAAVTTNILFNTAPTQGQLDNGYTPGQLYNLSININNLVTPTITTPRDGFQITALDASNDSAGTFALTPNATTTSLTSFFDRQYVGHKNAGSTNAWVFRWTAPAAGTGPVTFYITANRSNNNNASSGDNIYKQSFTFAEATVNPCTNFNAFINTPGSVNSFCSGDSLALTASSTGGPGNATYNWSGGEGTAATATVTAAGTYTVTVTEGTCTSTASLTVSSIAVGVADFSVSVSNNVVTINNNSTGVDGNYTWNFGDGTEFADNSASFSYTYDSAGAFTIEVSYTDVCGNSLTSSKLVTVSLVGVDAITLANALTIYPNPFGNETGIHINGYNGTAYQFTLVDITGRTVRSTEGVAGSTLQINREGLQSGMYFYTIEMQGEKAQGKLLID